MAKRVVYLIGAGATHGAASFHGFGKGLLMEDLKLDISNKVKENLKGPEIESDMGWAINELMAGADLERLISLFEYSATSKHSKIARSLRKSFREVLEERINEIGTDFVPELYVNLLDMHNIQGLDEELVAILTTNYEDLIERAVQRIYGGINYTINVILPNASYTLKNEAPPLLKLHGSFNWKNEFPISITSQGEQDEGIWIPPGVIKRKEYYPFNIIWGKAKELLNCDILRIIGSSLNQNDWDLIALITIAQGIGRETGKKLSIELIGSVDAKSRLHENHRYMEVVGIDEIPEVRDFIKKDYLGSDMAVNDDRLNEVIKEYFEESKNFFEVWLRAKGEKLLADGVSLETQNNLFKDFIEGDM